MSATSVKKFKPAHKYYGQLVLGPPGAGKTTYCSKMGELLKKSGRKIVIVNLDPANDMMSYTPDIDVRKLIDFRKVMDQNSLGPNGALIYCMEYLEKNIDWLLDQIENDNFTNFLFDLPGQVELYSHHESLSKIFFKLTNEKNIQCCVVHLVDSHHCSDPGKFIAALMLSLNAMLKIGLPHINLLTKVDLLKKHKDKLHFGIDFYTEVLHLDYLLDCLDTDMFTSKYKKLNSAIVSIIEDYSLVSFHLINMMNEVNLLEIKNLVDKTNGYVFKAEEGRHINSMLACAMGVGKQVNNDLKEL
ncbi:GPN-loop GTPase 2 [Achroia grisella]|uniref:GPN-loop GTPase 2 n=1 Tax=Achroia grisella TaxID=688607 RepID=UPI0027D2D5AF|nr:GPN-loop GTPase 2 [Achroia grisella]XP_059060201.1 GPN-loop GTPase 2 [Achroia grisella]